MTAQPVHATCIALDGRAILLAGRSGSGKSDLGLRLIDRGWALVADDYVDLVETGGRLIASPPASIAGRIEVRGVGLVAMPCVAGACVSLMFLLGEPMERLPEPGVWRHGGVSIPSLPINAFEASAPIKVEHSLRVYGI